MKPSSTHPWGWNSQAQAKAKDEDNWIRQSNLIEGVDSPEEDLRSFKAWSWLLKQACPNTYEGFEQAILLPLHRKIMLELWPDIAGKLRTVDVRVGERGCPSHTAVRGRLEQWFLMYRQPKSLVQVVGAHIIFERIHPFRDGNGRTGRMLMNWQAVNSACLSPINIKVTERQAYYDWFRV